MRPRSGQLHEPQAPKLALDSCSTSLGSRPEALAIQEATGVGCGKGGDDGAERDHAACCFESGIREGVKLGWNERKVYGENQETELNGTPQRLGGTGAESPNLAEGKDTWHKQEEGLQKSTRLFPGDFASIDGNWRRGGRLGGTRSRESATSALSTYHITSFM